MKAIADALVYAVTYINLRDASDNRYDDGDVGALESIAGFLYEATEPEQDALADAAERALRDEQAGGAREEFVRDYSRWMEEMFGDEDWQGNSRIRR